MDFRERFSDNEEALRIALDDRQAQMWTCLPGIIQSTSLGSNGNLTAVVQPAIKGTLRDRLGNKSSTTLPLIPDVPICFPRGGSYTLTFPVGQGDECLLVFACRCIDFWWQSGGVQLPVDARQHDLSDAFCIPGPFSQATKIGNVSAATAQIRTNDGNHFVEVDAPNGRVRLVSKSASLTLNGTSGSHVLDAGGGALTIQNAKTVSINP